MIYKYLVEKRIHIELIPSKSTDRSYSISYDKTMPLFDSYEEAFDRILRDKKDVVKKQKDELVGVKVEKLLASMTGDFDIEFDTSSKELGKQHYRIYKIEDGIASELKGKTIEIEEEFKVIKILKKNLTYALTSTFTDNKYNYQTFYSHFYENLENASIDAENLRYMEPEKFSQLSFFDKSKISKSEIVLDTVFKNFLDGEIKSSKVFDIFDKQLLSNKILDSLSDISSLLNENRVSIKDKDKEIEDTKNELKEANERIDKMLEEKNELRRKLKEIKEI